MLKLNIIKDLVDQSWSIERIASERPPRTWESVFEDAKHEIHDVSEILDDQENIHGMYYPLKSDIFNAFIYTQLSTVKVVIVGQDPYPQAISVNGVSVPRAVGLSFSVRQEDNIPSSLQNIYKELSNTVRGFNKPDHGDLREWARQGVLLLNTCLSVRPGVPGSHGDIWLGFINKVFKAIASINPNCIFMLWGKEAQKIKPMLGERSIILEAAHPSGLSASRGFFGCNHFNLANDALKKYGKETINWRISTLAELRNQHSVIPNKEPLTLKSNGHQPILTPIDMNMFPTIIPFKQVNPSSNVNIPDVIPLKPVINQVLPLMPPISQQQFPIIPNTTIPIFPDNKPISPQTTSDSQIKHKLTIPRTSPSVPIVPGIPIIPTIKFGLSSNTEDNTPVQSSIIKPIIEQQSTNNPIQLPIIPAII